ncbi:MAG: hypothetical protein R3230_00850 [Nitrosopumilaceae archaeon]|nr:hypothetical protein [Nitrosopumilaceae archaeon]
MANRFQVTSLDPDNIKDSLIEFFSQKPEFSDFDYEGSAINSIVDLLVRNAHMISYEANMVANESYLNSAQIRGNASSHSQKLSWVPRSRTSARLIADIVVTPRSDQPETSITCVAGSTFLRAVGGTTYTFTNTSDFTLFKNSVDSTYFVNDVELVQGQYISNTFIYDPVNTSKIFIPNVNVDTSTIRVFVKTSPTADSGVEFVKVDDISEVSTDSSVFYLGETRNEQYFIEFGKDILGAEPDVGSAIVIEYVVTEEEHGNKISELVAGSTIEGYSNITIDVTTPAYGGADKSTLEEIKFIAPRAYQSQNRAVRESDYVVEIKKRFPYIKSANVWGGEKNDPPYYGTVFISLITTDDVILTDTIKRDIEATLDSVNVVTITPQVVDTSYIDIDLNTQIIFNNKVTKKTFGEIKSIVSDIIESYADKILDFDSYYNNSELIDLIRAGDNSIESVELDKTVYVTQSSVQNTLNKYSINFKNEIEEGSLVVSNIKTDINSISETIYDSDGIIYNRRVINGNTVDVNIGTINYESGLVEFTLTNLNSGDIKITIEPTGDNFYSNLQSVLRLNNNSITQIFRDR